MKSIRFNVNLNVKLLNGQIESNRLFTSTMNYWPLELALLSSIIIILLKFDFKIPCIKLMSEYETDYHCVDYRFRLFKKRLIKNTGRHEQGQCCQTVGYFISVEELIILHSHLIWSNLKYFKFYSTLLSPMISSKLALRFQELISPEDCGNIC